MLKLRHLETDVTQACQLSCVACNHHVPLWRKHGPWMADPKQVEHDLTRLARIMHTEKWGALGGEPLLHKKLVDILHIARDSGIADQIEVWSNGLLVESMPPAFWRSLDILVLSIYPGVLGTAALIRIEDLCATHGVQLEKKDERTKPNFRTLFEPTQTRGDVTRRKFEQCFFRKYSRSASYGYFFTCCCAPHMPMLMQSKPFGTDGIPIHGISEAALLEYLTRTEPLGACDLCAGRETAVKIPWSEERQPLRWIEKSRGMA